MPPYPKVLQAKECVPNSLFFRYFHFKLTFESINELRNALIMVCQRMIQILPQVTIRNYLMKREYHRCCQQMVIFLLLQSWRRDGK